MKSLLPILALAILAVASAAFAADDAAKPVAPIQTAPAASSTSVAPAPQIPQLFLKPVFLRGTLGDANIQVNIRPKADIEEGLEGEYFVFGRSLKILLAGEIEDDVLFMEESENGTDISGQWDGKLQGDTLAGSWMSPDGAISKPFSLKVMPASAPVKKISANARKH